MSDFLLLFELVVAQAIYDQTKLGRFTLERFEFLDAQRQLRKRAADLGWRCNPYAFEGVIFFAEEAAVRFPKEEHRALFMYLSATFARHVN